MGASESVPLTHERLFELTKSTRSVMNLLLEYMLKEITVRDFMALSDPEQCKKYVLFMANNIYKQFYELQVVPTRDKNGILAFRLAKDLTNPTKETEQEKQGLCLTLSYFYTRIFQIYGALALTLIDDVSFMTDTGLVQGYTDSSKQLHAPGYRPYQGIGGVDALPYGYAPPPYGYMQPPYGYPPPAKPITSSIGNFTFLRTFLTADTDSSKGTLTKYEGADNNKGLVYFKLRDQENGNFVIEARGAKHPAYLEVSSKNELGSKDYRMTIGKLRYQKKRASAENKEESATMDLPIEIVEKKSLLIEYNNNQYSIKDSTKSIDDYFMDLFRKIIPVVKSIVEDSYNSSSYSSSTASEAGTEEKLRLGRMISNLRDVKPLGHCVARAMQLLRTIPLQGQAGLSSICKDSLFESTVTTSTGTRTTTSRSGLPVKGQSLNGSPGLEALAFLFYDAISEGTPKLVIGKKIRADGKSSYDHYIAFMRKMADLFQDNKDPVNQSKARSINSFDAGLSSIKNKRDKDKCTGVAGDKPIAVAPQDVGGVHTAIKELFQTQLVHATACGKIFQALFNIQRDKTTGQFRISLSDFIIKNGFPAIDKINGSARELLVNYYSNCETTYLKGMNLVLESKRRTNAMAAPIAAPMAAPIAAPKAAPIAPQRPGQPLVAPGIARAKPI
uniref:Uncharacterized protein n=1 Tax=viral metagenome TaxID=1070528 RepID=A0A6C0KT32_9ZZZZ